MNGLELEGGFIMAKKRSNKTKPKSQTQRFDFTNTQKINLPKETREERYRDVAMFYSDDLNKTMEFSQIEKRAKYDPERPEPRTELKKQKRWNYSHILNVLLILVLACDFLFLDHSFRFGKAKQSGEVTKAAVKEGTKKEKIVFFGDSITQGYKLDEYYYGHNVVNSGIGGNVVSFLMKRIEKDLYDLYPTKVVILIGTNDLTTDKPKDVAKNIEKMIQDIKKNLPDTEIYLQSIYPVNRNEKEKKINMDTVGDRNNRDIKKTNQLLEEMADREKIHYIDVYSSLCDDEGNLKLDYTNEGLHISDLGYVTVTRVIKDALQIK